MGILPELDLPRDPQKDLYLRTNDETWKTMMKNSPLMRTTNQDILEELNKLAKKAEEEKEGSEDKSKVDPPSEKADDSIDYGDDLSFEGSKIHTIFSKFFGDRKIEFLSTKQKRADNNIYEWKIHGYSTLEEYFPEIAKDIDLRYDYIVNLTLECFGEIKGVKTQPFRKAIQYYIELIHGYEYVDFDYKKINTLLHKDMKLAVKTIASTPQNINFGIINKFPEELETYEICHIALLAMEAKFHIELMYGILALQNAKE